MANLNFLSDILLFIIVIYFSPSVFGDAGAKFTEKEKLALMQFRPRVEGMMTQDYMKEDIYLLKFLTAKSLDVESATDMIQKAMQWRKENNIDEILNEDLSEIFKHAPYWMEGTDKESRPVVITNNGRWDIRRFAITGGRNMLTRHWDQMMEKVALKTRELGNSTTEHDVTQAVFIMDIEGYNLRQQGCFSCLSIFLEWMSHTENYYPENFKSLNMVNTPRIFSPLLEILKPAMSQSTRKILHAYGPNKKEWSELLLKTIPADQLPPLYGGTAKKSG